MKVETIGVCGAGTMGSGIAQAAAQAGFNTILYELNTSVLEKSRSAINSNLELLVQKSKIDIAEKGNILDRIRFTSDINMCIAHVLIEAIVEKLEAKTALFNQLAQINNAETIFATNTSSLPVTAIAKGIVHPERVIGMHFFNPATLMKLVEVINTEFTSTSTTDAVIALVKKMGKTPVICKDSPGFIVNRVARPYYIEALRLAEAGADLAQIDRLLENNGFKLGAFKLMDLIGNDINYAVSCSVYEQLGNPERLKPSFIQKEKVEKGELGKKSGQGYYNYSNPV